MVKVKVKVKAFMLAFFMASAASASSNPGSVVDECGVYLAESSTQHVLGTFAGRRFERDDVIGARDATVQFVDIRERGSAVLSPDDRQRLEGFLATCWSGDATAGMAEGDEVVSAVGGPCFSSTGHVGMINAVIHQPSTLLRTDTDLLASGYDERTSPGRGAFTTYHNLTLLAVENITPGMEIFLDFGTEFSGYDDATKPNIDDYRKMDEAMAKMVAFFHKHGDGLGDKAAAEVYEFLKHDVLNLTAARRAPAARALLPATYHGLQEILDGGGSALSSNPEVVRDVGWLKMNGYCQDNIAAGVSEIAHAGRGAFAARDMRKGEVVSAMPLVALNQGRTALTVVHEDEDDDDARDDDAGEEATAERETRQLLYNYMLEHPQSSALFLPAGAMTLFVNHGGKGRANVKMIWSTKEWSDVQGAHATPVDDLTLVGPIDMVLELVALRPIQRGEEFLLDYGDDWAAAWQDHSSQWEEASEDDSFSASAMVRNEVHHGLGRPARPFPTAQENEDRGGEDEEGGEDAAHPVLHCHLMYDEDNIERRRNADGSRTKVYPWIPHPVAGEARLKTAAAVRGTHRRACDVVERAGDARSGYAYVVRPQRGEGPEILVRDVPHHALRYVDRPYASAQHGARAFRHAIRFPDEIFPEAWRDLAEEDRGGHNDEL